MRGKVAKALRKEVNLKDINRAREDVTYFLFGNTRRIKDESLKRYKRAKQMYKDEYLKEYVS